MERMSKFVKKLVAFALVLVMVIGMVPSGVFAEDDPATTDNSVVKLSAYLKWEVEQTSGSTDDSSEPSEDPSEPSGDSSEPSEDPSEPSEDPSEPSEDPSEPSEDPSEPSGDSSEPSEDPSEPSGAASESSESAPLTREAAGSEENQNTAPTYIYSVVVQTQKDAEPIYTLDPVNHPETDSYDVLWIDNSSGKELKSTSKTMSATVTYDGITMTLVRGEDATADCGQSAPVTAGLNELSTQTLYMSDANGHATSWDVKKALPSNVSVKPGNDACFVVSVDNSEVLDISALDVTAKTCGKATVSVTLKGLSDTVYAQQSYAFTVSNVCNITVEGTKQGDWYTDLTTVTITYNKAENEEDTPKVTVSEEGAADQTLSFKESDASGNMLTMTLTFCSNRESEGWTSYDFGDGKYTVSFLKESMEINVDTVDPTVTITSIQNSDTLLVTAEVTDGTSGVNTDQVTATVKTNGSEKTADLIKTENNKYTFEVEGHSYTEVKVTAKDNAGHSATATNNKPLICTLDGVDAEEDNGNVHYFSSARDVTVVVSNAENFDTTQSKVIVDDNELNNWSVDKERSIATLTIKLTDEPVETDVTAVYMDCLTNVSVELHTTDNRSLTKSLLKENTKLIVDTKAPVLTLSATTQDENGNDIICDVASHNGKAFVWVPTVEDKANSTNKEIEVTVTGQIKDKNFDKSCYEAGEKDVVLKWNEEGTEFTYKVTVKAGEAGSLPLPSGGFKDKAENPMEKAEFIGAEKDGEQTTQEIDVTNGRLTGEIYVDRKSPDNGDTDAPTISLIDAEDTVSVEISEKKIYTSETVQFEVKVSDNDSGLDSIKYWTSLDNNRKKDATEENGKQFITIDVQDTELDGFQIFVCATDEMGNSRTVCKSINVDTMAPRVSFSRSSAEKNVVNEKDYFKEPVTYTVTVKDLNLSSGLTCTVDEEAKDLVYSEDKTEASYSVELIGTDNNMEFGKTLTSIVVTAKDNVDHNTEANLNGAEVTVGEGTETDDGYTKEVDTAAPSIEISSNIGTPGVSTWNVTVTPTDANFDQEKSYVRYSSSLNSSVTEVKYNKENGNYVLKLEASDEALDPGELLQSLSICIVDYVGNYGSLKSDQTNSLKEEMKDGAWTGVWVLGSVVENDITAPDIIISPLGKATNTVNEVDYYDEVKTITVTVQDRNLDLAKTTISYTLNGEDQTVSGTAMEADAEKDGVYNFSITLDNGDRFDGLTVHAEDTFGCYKESASKAVIPNPVVIDTVAPTATVKFEGPLQKAVQITDENEVSSWRLVLKKDAKKEVQTITMKITIKDRNLVLGDNEGEKQVYLKESSGGTSAWDKTDNRIVNGETNQLVYSQTFTIQPNDKPVFMHFNIHVEDIVGHKLSEAAVTPFGEELSTIPIDVDENGSIKQELYFVHQDPSNIVWNWPVSDYSVPCGDVRIPLYNDDFNVDDVLSVSDDNGIASVEVTLENDIATLDVSENEKNTFYNQSYGLSIDINDDIENNEVTLTAVVCNGIGVKTTEEKVIAIDNKAPRVEVEYNNNSVKNDKYFKGNRIVTISVEDLNFDADESNITINGEQLSTNWTKADNPNKWTTEYKFENDGEYTLALSCSDLARNNTSANNEKKDDAVIFAEGTLAPWEFILDKTAPECTVTISGAENYINSANGTDYYNDRITITVKITDTYVEKAFDSCNKNEIQYELNGEDKGAKVTKSEDNDFAEFSIILNGLGNGENVDPTKHGDILSALSIVFQDPAGNDVIMSKDNWKKEDKGTEENKWSEWSYTGNKIEVDNTNPKIVEIKVPTDPVNTDAGVAYYAKQEGEEEAFEEVTFTIEDINLDLAASKFTYTLDKKEVTSSLQDAEDNKDGTYTFTNNEDGKYTVTIRVNEGQEFEGISVNAVDYCKLTDKKNKVTHFVVDATAPTAKIELSCKDKYNKELVSGFYTNINDDNVIFVKLDESYGNIEEATLNLTVTVTDNNIRVWSGTVNEKQASNEKQACYVYNAINDSTGELSGEPTDVNNLTEITYEDSVTVEVNKEGVIPLKLHVADLAGNKIDQIENIRVQSIEQSTYTPVIEKDTGIINNIFSLDRRAATSVEDENTAPCLILTPDKEKVGTTNEGVDLYDSSFEFKLTVRDATDEQIKLNSNEAYSDYLNSANALCSGLKTVSWEVKDEKGTVIADSEDRNYPENTTAGIPYIDTFEIPINVKENGSGESNEVTIEVTATDNNGNRTYFKHQIAVDKLAPRVTVAYSNNNVQNGKYFKADRIATITVKDINFNAETTKVTTQVPISEWKETSPDVWVATSTYSQDGDYTFQMESTDRAGNKTASADVNYAGSAPNEFTIDKTAPVITVTYNNNSSMNGKYYNAGRIGSITIREHNFASKDFRSAITASLDGVGIAVPTVNGWSRSGDNNGASVNFTADGDYTMKLDYTDLAGNPATTYTESPFTVDTVIPEIEISMDDYSANSGTVAPEVTITDINFDANGYSIPVQVLQGLNAGAKTYNWSSESSSIRNGVKVSFVNIQKVKDNDGVYILTAKVTDLAGNENTQRVTFSVNRFGSTYIAYDQATKDLLESGYSKSAPTVCIQEINPNAISNNKVVLSVGGDTFTLVQGTDYTVDATTGKDCWNGALYTISSDVFMKNGELAEGAYELQFYSNDEAKNSNSNRSNEGGLSVRFTLDDSAPVVSITGIGNGDRIRAEARDITLFYSDSSGIREIIIYLDGEEYARLSEEDIAANPNSYLLTIDQSNSDRKLSVVIVDAAGNELRTDDITFFLNGSIFQQYLHNTPLLIGSIVGVVAIAALIVFLIKRKKKQSAQ